MDVTEWLQLGGWVVYLLASIGAATRDAAHLAPHSLAAGYVIIDAMTAANVPIQDNVDNGVYMLLAALFVIDASLYYVAWHISSYRRRHKAPFVLNTAGWGELLFFVSAALYLLQAALVFVHPFRSPDVTFALTLAQGRMWHPWRSNLNRA